MIPFLDLCITEMHAYIHQRHHGSVHSGTVHNSPNMGGSVKFINSKTNHDKFSKDDQTLIILTHIDQSHQWNVKQKKPDPWVYNWIFILT